MNNGWIKTAAVSPKLRVADCSYNAQHLIAVMREAAAKGISLLVTPELGLTGYTCGDLFLQTTLLEGALEALSKVVQASVGLEMLVVVGVPLSKEGSLYNCAAVILNGSILGVIPKTHLPNYAEFEEVRHFSPAPVNHTSIRLFGQALPFGSKLLFVCKEQEAFCLAVEICEDLWAVNPPSVQHAQAGATVVANLSASPETIGKDQYRRDLVCQQSARLLCGYVYANAGEGESTTDLVFAGHNLIAENGRLLAQGALFSTEPLLSELDVEYLQAERRRITTFQIAGREDYRVIPFSLSMGEVTLTRTVLAHPFIPEAEADRGSRCQTILALQARGLKKRAEHTHCRTLVIGISGGLDSTLALLCCVHAMDLMRRPRADIVAVTMPCFGTTQRTRGNAELLCEALGVALKCVDIKASVKQHFWDIGQSPVNHNVVYENAQARERTQVLMDIANQCNGMVIGTGDLSELALGWATYNGDHMSMYGVNASIPKTLVRCLVEYAAQQAEEERLREVLLDILATPVSPELLPAQDEKISQKTEDIVGPYELHDFFLYQIVRFGFAPAKVLALAEYAFGAAYQRAVLVKWLRVFYRRFFAQQFKRSCLPDGPKIGSVGLSPRGDWKMPSDACATLWLAQVDQL